MRRDHGYPPITEWWKMKRKLQKQFIPPTYEENNFTKLQNHRQRLTTVEDYINEFYLLSSQVTTYESEVQKDCIKVLQKKFPESTRVGRLEGMLLEAKGSWGDAQKTYTRLLEDSPLDQVILKRRVAVAKAQGDTSEAIECLNKYLEIFMADHDAWRELAEIYVSLQMYKQAAFCYEELILCQPTVPLHHLTYADLLYTLGGLENLQTAKKYYASTIDLTGGKNTRALYGICLLLSLNFISQCSMAMGQLIKGGRNKEDKDSSELQSLAATALEKDYSKRAPNKLSLLTATLKNMKL
ncbi:hypothetical protein GIB67_024956 [Kingdonia uniflora]|uniref:ER membrane protein complex subunit 2 n=1 Tax=Kingdonia uniflora TaxID=39325 RepID=A0A7J7NZG6_9MAGN|nr:hypothetical protein GIB67_024956 [Kingdonia uniflora]